MNNPSLSSGGMSSPEHSVEAYHQLGLPAVADRGSLAVRTSDQLAAVQVPARLGLLMQHWLAQFGLKTPIVGTSAGWTFLCTQNAPLPLPAEVVAELRAAGAVVYERGTKLALPHTTNSPVGSASSWWVTRLLAAGNLAALTTVVCAAKMSARPLRSPARAR